VLNEGREHHGAEYVRSKLHAIDLNSPPPTAVPPQPAPPPLPHAHTSKAEVLKHWRTQRGRRPFPESLLLRDALYLLQGIDGRYVRFDVAPANNANGAANGNGTANGRTVADRWDRSETEILGDEDETILGIDIVVDEPKVSAVSEL